MVSETGSFVKNGQLWTYLIPHIHEVELDYSRLDALLEEAKKIWKSKVPPEGNAGCDGCDELMVTFALQKAVEKEMRVQDQRVISMSGHNLAVVNAVLQRDYDRRSRVYSALDRVLEQGSMPTFSNATMAANWEYYV